MPTDIFNDMSLVTAIVPRSFSVDELWSKLETEGYNNLERTDITRYVSGEPYLQHCARTAYLVDDTPKYRLDIEVPREKIPDVLNIFESVVIGGNKNEKLNNAVVRVTEIAQGMIITPPK